MKNMTLVTVNPEQPKRVIAIKEKLKKRADLIWEKPGCVPDDILAMTHSKEYIRNLNSSFPQQGLKFLDGGYCHFTRQ